MKPIARGIDENIEILGLISNSNTHIFYHSYIDCMQLKQICFHEKEKSCTIQGDEDRQLFPPQLRRTSKKCMIQHDRKEVVMQDPK